MVTPSAFIGATMHRSALSASCMKEGRTKSQTWPRTLVSDGFFEWAILLRWDFLLSVREQRCRERQGLHPVRWDGVWALRMVGHSLDA